jgi:hypothetical protein
MVKFELTIRCESAALKLPNGDVNRPMLALILHGLAQDVTNGRDMKRTLRDSNGTVVGECTVGNYV